MRVVPRRRKGREGPQDAATAGGSGGTAVTTAEPSSPSPPASASASSSSVPSPRTDDTGPHASGPPPGEAAARRRARSAARQRAAMELKRSRAARRRGPTVQERAVREYRSSVLTMVVLLGLLIAAVVVSGGLIAASMRTRPVTLAAPLHIYPVVQTVPGQCPAGTRGITGQSSSGLTCYRLTQGIAIRKVADLRVQRARSRDAYDVAVTLRANDRRAFAALTRATLHRDLAFVVRERLVTVPRVDTPILDGKVVITGPPTKAEANRLARSLRGR